MIFAESRINKSNGMTILDGYSKAKTIKSAIKDLAKEVSKINESEGNCIVDNIEDTISNLNTEHFKDCYFIDCEEVGSASRINEETEEIEYKESNFYLCIGFFA